MLKALQDHIIVEKPQDTEQKKGSIFLITKNPIVLRAKVVSVGKGREDKNGKRTGLNVTPGQTVLFSKGSGQEVQYENKKYIFFKPEDILAVLKDNGV